MTTDFVIGFARQTIEVTLMLAAPALGFGLAAGLTISIFQAVTQIQEMTLTFIPKIVLTFIAIVIFGPWMLQILLSFISNLLINIPNYVK